MCQRGCYYEDKYGDCVGGCITVDDCPRLQERMAVGEEEDDDDV